MNLEDLDLLKTYLIAVSGGPDSMALLHRLQQKGFSLVICHVNYHTRPESIIEQREIEKYAQEHHLRLHVLDTKDIKRTGNFEAWARKVRYQFFKKQYDFYHADGIFIAHHQGDDLETYLMQKQRGGYVTYYGIREVTEIMGMRVIRPLLKENKEELLAYCQRNSIFYSLDSTNLDTKYKRNFIRLNILGKMSDEEKTLLFKEKEEQNEKLRPILLNVENKLSKDYIALDEYKQLSTKEQDMLLYAFIKKYLPFVSLKLSKARIVEIKRMIESKKPNLKMLLEPPYYLIKEYNRMIISKEILKQSYEITIEKPCIINHEYFYLDLTKDTSVINVFDYSYPLTIRNHRSGDVVRFGKIHKNVNRIFINQKIPMEKRKHWPLILDRNGNIIYIPLTTVIPKITMEKDIVFMVK